MITLGLLVTLANAAVPGTAAAQTPTCRIYGSTSFGNSAYQGGTKFTFFGSTSANPQGVVGVTLPCPLDEGDQIRVEAWMSGAQSGASCWTPATASGSACISTFSLGPSFAPGTLDGDYFHGGIAYHTWCSNGRHVFINTVGDGGSTQGANSNFCDDLGPTPQEFCHSIDAGYNWETGMCDEMIPTYEDPIIVPVGKSQTYKLTDAVNGVVFDINADGVLDQTAWTARDSGLAFLAIDRNGNGRIDDGSELFGNRTLPVVFNGFRALGKYAPITGPTGWIDSDDQVFASLLLWEDRNHNGISEAEELRPASEVYSRFGLGVTVHDRKDGHGNRFQFLGWALKRTAAGKNEPKSGKEEKERQVSIYDVIFAR